MPLGQLQLIYEGIQSVYLVKDPEITFFKTIYKRHTNFSSDTVQEFFNGSVKFGKKIKCTLSKNGDLLSRMAVYFKLSALNTNFVQSYCNSKMGSMCTCSECLFGSESNQIQYGYVNAIGHALIEYVELYIGGQLIDRHYGEWLEIWTELSQPAEKRLGYYEMIGKKDPISYTFDSFPGPYELYVPLNFWFCRNIGMSLPVLCLNESFDIDIIIKLRKLDELWVSNKKKSPTPNASIDACIYADYYYLSTAERFVFLDQKTHTYIIEQVQRSENNNSIGNTGVLNIDIDFNHPVKELIWIVQRTDVIGPPDGVYEADCSYPKGNDHFNFTTSKIPRLNPKSETFKTGKIMFDGTDRTLELPASYFRLWTTYYQHTRIPTANNIYCYSFAISPEEQTPSGSVDFSTISNPKLNLKLFDRQDKIDPYPITSRVYATNYNVFMLSCGVAGLLFYN